MYKVIFHVDELGKWDLTLANAKNLINEIRSEKYEVAILANAIAVKGYLDNQYVDRMNDLVKDGVKFIACNNALKGNNITPDMIFSFVEIVPAGVLELTKKQNIEKYAYIRP